MSLNKINVTIDGRRQHVDSAQIDDKTILITGTLLRTASVKDEVCDSGIDHPADFIRKLQQLDTGADLFVFEQKLPDTTPRYPYPYDLDNHAALEIQSYDHWWNKQIGNDARRMVRKATKQGVTIRLVPFSDDLIAGIKNIYDEAEVRRGKPFWHYNKPFSEVKEDNQSFIDRSDFLGAYFNDELIGFDKIIYTGCWAAQIQLIAQMKHRDKCVINALLSKAVELCAERNVRFLTYGAYTYGRKGPDALTDFKKRNGFHSISYPRYYVPLTLKGELAVRMNLHKRIVDILPNPILSVLLRLRNRYYSTRP